MLRVSLRRIKEEDDMPAMKFGGLLSQPAQDRLDLSSYRSIVDGGLSVEEVSFSGSWGFCGSPIRFWRGPYRCLGL
jgi:hypothetical protein